MSYTRTYRNYVPYSGSVSGSFSYPASQNGGSKSVTLSYSGQEEVTIDIEVDTNPFDNSVGSCKNNVNGLTATVVATQAAQIKEIKNSAKEISKTIVNGFFKTVSSEISQQISALENEANSSLLHLTETSQKVHELKKRMEIDYNRITERYLKTFEDLNTELATRIMEIDRRVFEFEKVANKNSERFLSSGLSNMVSIFGKENAFLSAKISVAIAKNIALSAINKARAFLSGRKRVEDIIQNVTIPEAKEKFFYVPSCFTETDDKSFNIHLTENNTALNNSQIEKNIVGQFKTKKLNWQSISDKECEQISMYLNTCINDKYNSPEPRAKRVREMVQKLVNLQGVQICRN